MKIVAQETVDAKVSEALNELLHADGVVKFPNKKNASNDPTKDQNLNTTSLTEKDLPESVSSKELTEIGQQAEEAFADLESQLSLAAEKIIEDNIVPTVTPNSAKGSNNIDPNLIPNPQPANDLNKLQVNKSFMKTGRRNIYWGTTALSAMWALGGAFAAKYFMQDPTYGSSNFMLFFSSLPGVLLSLATILPIGIFWSMAKIINRSKEVEKAAAKIQMISEQLINPQKIVNHSAQQLTSAIRKEIYYNEERIQSMMQHLVQERRLILSQAEKIKASLDRTKQELRDKINNNESILSADMKAASAHLTNLLADMRQTLQQDFATASNEAINALQQKVADMNVSLSDASKNLLTQIGVDLSTLTNESLSILSSHSEAVAGKISNVVDQNSENAIKTLNYNISAISNKLDKVSHALEEHTEQTLAKFSGNLEFTAQKVQQELGSMFEAADQQSSHLLNKITSTQTELMLATQELHNNINYSAHDLTNQLTSAGDNLVQSLLSSSQKLEEHLEVAAHNAGDHIQTVTENTIGKLAGAQELLINSVTEMGAAVDHTTSHTIHQITNEASSLKQELETAASKVAEAIAESAKGTIESLEHGSAKVGESLSNFHNQLNFEVNHIDKAIKSNSEQLTEILHDSTYSIIDQIDNKVQLVQSSLTENSELVVNSLAKQAEIYSDSLYTSTDRVLTAIDESSQLLSDSSMQVEANITATFAAGIEQLTNCNQDALKEALAKYELLFKDRILQVEDAISKGEASFNSLLEQQYNMLEEAYLQTNEHGQAQIVEYFNQLEAKTNELRSTWQQTGQQFIASLEDKALNLVQTITGNGDKLEQLFVDQQLRVAENNETLQLTLDEHGKKLQDHQIELAYLFNNNTDLLNNNLVTKLDVIEDSFSEISNKFVADIYNMQEQLHNIVTTNGDILEEKVSTQLETINHKAEQTKELLNEFDLSVDNSLINLVSKVESRLHELNHVFDNQLENYSEIALGDVIAAGSALKDELETIKDTISQLSEDVATKISEKYVLLRSTTDNLSDNFKHDLALLDELSDKATNKAEQSLELNEEIISKQLTYLETYYTKFEDKFNTLCQAATELFDDNMSAISNNLASTTEAMHHNIASSTSPILDKIIAVREDLTTSIYNLFSEKVTENQTDLITQLTDKSLNSVDKLQNIHNNLEEVLANTLTTLDKSSETFSTRAMLAAKEIQDADNRLQAIYNQMVDSKEVSAEKFERTIEDINNKLTQFNNLSEAASEKLISYSNNFSENSKNLMSLVDTLHDADTNAHFKLEEHKAILEQLSASLLLNGENIKESIAGFKEFIEESINRRKLNDDSDIAILETKLLNYVQSAVKDFNQAQDDMGNNIALSLQEKFDLTLQTEIKEQLTAALNKQASTLDQLAKLTEIVTQNQEIMAKKEIEASYQRVLHKAQASENIQPISSAQSISSSKARMMMSANMLHHDKDKLKLSNNDFSTRVANIAEKRARLERVNSLNTANSTRTEALLNKQRNEKSSSLAEIRKKELINVFNETGNKFAKPAATAENAELSLNQLADTNSKMLKENSANHVQPASHSDVLDKLHNIPSVSSFFSINNASLLDTVNTILAYIDEAELEKAWTSSCTGNEEVSYLSIYKGNGKRLFEKLKILYTEKKVFKQQVDHYLNQFEAYLDTSNLTEGDFLSLTPAILSDAGKIYTVFAHISGCLK